jgi:thioredoxin 1
MAHPVVVTDATFAEVVEQRDGLVVVDLWAEWCGPCRILGPTLEALAAEYEGRVVIAKLDVDANPVTSERFDVRSIPTLLFFRGGTMVHRSVGALPKAQLARKIEQHEFPVDASAPSRAS